MNKQSESAQKGLDMVRIEMTRAERPLPSSPGRTAVAAALLAQVMGACGSMGESSDVKSEPAAENTTAGGRPIVVQDARTLVWAADRADQVEPEYFDFTDSSIDPRQMNHGIGRDRIASIDAPEFVSLDDPRLGERGIDATTLVLGVRIGDVAKAYPLVLMVRHEIVNDWFEGHPFAVLW